MKATMPGEGAGSKHWFLLWLRLHIQDHGSVERENPAEAKCFNWMGDSQPLEDIAEVTTFQNQWQDTFRFEVFELQRIDRSKSRSNRTGNAWQFHVLGSASREELYGWEICSRVKDKKNFWILFRRH